MTGRRRVWRRKGHRGGPVPGDGDRGARLFALMAEEAFWCETCGVWTVGYYTPTGPPDDHASPYGMALLYLGVALVAILAVVGAVAIISGMVGGA